MAGVDPADRRLRRGARHRHGAGRPDRGRGARPGLPRAAPAARLLRPRLGQDQHRPPRRGGRRRRADQGRPGPASTGRSRRACTSSGRTRRSTSRPARSTSTPRCAPGRRTATPRRAGVSSFGIGGTNAHVVLEEAPAPPTRPAPSRAWQLLLLSARTAAALDAAAANLAAHLRAETRTPPSPTSPTPCRRARRSSSTAGSPSAGAPREAVAALRRAAEPRPARPAWRAEARPPGGLPLPRPGRAVPGHGARRCTAPSRSSARRSTAAPSCCGRISGSTCASALCRRRCRRRGRRRASSSRPRLAQPALFVIEYALARLWMSWGVAAAGDARPQRRRVRGRLPGRRLLAGGRAAAGGGARRG